MQKESQNKEKERRGALIFGLTMQERKQEIPRDVAEWISQRLSVYPVDYQVDVDSFIDQELTKKFKKIYAIRGGVTALVFLYPEEKWSVRIIGGLDKNGELLGNVDGVVSGLSAELRNKISGYTEEDLNNLVEIKEGIVGVLRASEESDINPEHVSVNVDHHWTSELTLSGKKLEAFSKMNLNNKNWDDIKKELGEDTTTH